MATARTVLKTPLNAFQKRWLAAETAANIDAAWCELPGPACMMPEEHQFNLNVERLQESARFLADEGDSDAARFMAQVHGMDAAEALEAIQSGDFDIDTGWEFTHEGVTHHLDPDMKHWRDDPAGPKRLECESCGWEGADGEQKPLEEVRHLWERVAPGELMPHGECPKCGCLVHEREVD